VRPPGVEVARGHEVSVDVGGACDLAVLAMLIMATLAMLVMLAMLMLAVLVVLAIWRC
jgi:hypothetical protein